MDMRQFAGSSFITVETLRDGPREEVIVSVAPGKYDKPVVTFESGDQAFAQQDERQHAHQGLRAERPGLDRLHRRAVHRHR